MLLSILLSIPLFGLGLIHFSWALGGEVGFAASLPTKENGERILNPKKIECAIVGIGLSAFGLFYIFNSGLIDYNLPAWIIAFVGWAIPTIFIIRAVGDFNYVGFSKRIKNTVFGKLDTKFFSPLCLVIGIVGFIIQLVK